MSSSRSFRCLAFVIVANPRPPYALLDRLITINMPEPDDLTQQEIVIQKTEIDRASANFIVTVVQSFRRATHAKDSSGLRSCLIIAKICQDHEVEVAADNFDFREICQDILLSRVSQPFGESRQLLWNIFNSYVGGITEPDIPAEVNNMADSDHVIDSDSMSEADNGAEAGSITEATTSLMGHGESLLDERPTSEQITASSRAHPELVPTTRGNGGVGKPSGTILPSSSTQGLSLSSSGAVATLERPDVVSVHTAHHEAILDGHMPNIILDTTIEDKAEPSALSAGT